MEGSATNRNSRLRVALRETLGVSLLALGVFVLTSLVTYHPADYEYLLLAEPAKFHNLGGPVGVLTGQALLGAIGLIAVLWTVGLLVWGGMITLGVVVWPRVQLAGVLFALTFTLAALAHLGLPPGLPLNLPHGFGGAIGEGIATALLRSIGYGGALIGLGTVTTAILALAGFLKVSRFSRVVEWVFYALRRMRARRARAKSLRAARLQTTDIPGAGPPPSVAAVAGTEAGPSGTTPDHWVPDFSCNVPTHGQPSPAQFQRSEIIPETSGEFDEISAELEHQLREFKVDGRITGVTEGPVVTTLEFEPAAGTKVAKIASLGDDLARLLRADSLRILTPVPGKKTVGFEVPNAQRSVICFGDLVEHKQFRDKKKRLPIAMGVDTFGNPVISDLADMPHLLVAGATGSGKSVFINTLIASLVLARTAQQLRLVMIDPKMIELRAYGDLPHLACPVITNPREEAAQVLEQLVHEMEDRYRRMGAVGARNIDGFNKVIRSRRKTEFHEYHGAWEELPYIVLLVDEFADLMLTMGKQAEGAITRLAQKARAAGIHLVIATQRPSVNVVTGLIKANFPSRIAFRVLSGTDSRTILDQTGAELLLGKGDLIYQSATGAQRLHASFLDDEEVNGLVSACL